MIADFIASMITVRFPTIVLLAAFCCCCLALECYTGFKYIRGQSVELTFISHCEIILGTSKTKCESDSDYCYNATADLTALNEIKMAGCSTTRCFLSRNKCIEQVLQGVKVKFCCCNTGDLCNSKMTVSFYIPLVFTANLTFFEKAKQRAKDLLKAIG
ncbi:hypothetical protein OESDEN_11255 [Oesophagostomum dentatum]|uniref:Activin types I and II receptor domain protein n=1 Tax=Oesophagostomum dentatum TaxID=61180 RepID=A0A0B1T0H7_OESDE|nr:hypothetical protein OESDEN_11255 [Oesophagostomum dentatum]